MECLLEDDPIAQKSLIGKTVSIRTIDKEIHEGIIYVVDPISKTVVLVSECREDLKLLMPHAVASIEIRNEAKCVDSNFHTNALLFGSDIEERRLRLKTWFKKNLIDVSEDGLTLRIQDDFYITPPYTIDQCVSSNKFILERMITLIERMP